MATDRNLQLRSGKLRSKHFRSKLKSYIYGFIISENTVTASKTAGKIYLWKGAIRFLSYYKYIRAFSRHQDMNGIKAALRNEVEKLAEEAFHRKLISGYGDGPNTNEYQIVFKGKPRHLPLEQARSFLGNLILSSSLNRHSPVNG